MSTSVQAGGYVVPSYRAPEDTSWYHFLHGNVPGHQIDFMYRAEVPQGQLSRQHFSHLSRLMKYIEPQTNSLFAFAIGNLSRDDTQYEPGHGGVALIFGLRIRGTTDHAGRHDPPFAHGIAAIDRELDYGNLLAAATAFHRRVLGSVDAAAWYRTYVTRATDAPADIEHVLSGYVEGFEDLPRLQPSALSTRWVTGGAPQPRRIVISHDNDTPFEFIAHCAARIAAMLYRSDIRWTSISNGREADVPNGVTVRFVADRDLSPSDLTEKVRRLEEVPDDEAEIARQLFGASMAEEDAKPVLGWRQLYAGAAASSAAEAEAAMPAAPQGEVQRPSWEGRAFQPPSHRPPPMASGSAEVALSRSSSPPRSPVAEEEATNVWKGRGEAAPPETADDEEITIDTEGFDNAETVPQPLVAEAAEKPRSIPPVTNGNEAGAKTSVAVERPAVLSASTAPTVIEREFVVPDFRRSRSPALRWLVMVAAAAGAALAFWSFAMDGTTPFSPEGAGSETSAAAANTEMPAEPSPPAPAVLPTAEAAPRSAQMSSEPAKSGAGKDSGKAKGPSKSAQKGKPSPAAAATQVPSDPSVSSWLRARGPSPAQ